MVTMPEQPLPFPPKPDTDGSRPVESRVILSIGKQRYAIDVTTSITELPARTAEVIPMPKREP
jgi:hypothetical protein